MEKLDLKRYQTAALVEQVAEALDVGSAIFAIFQSVALITGSLFLIANLVLYFGGASWTTWAMIAIYVLFVAGLLGVAIGFLRVAKNYLKHTSTVLQLLIGVTRQAKSDLASVQTGKAALPTNAEIMWHAYQDVVFPTVQQVILKSGNLFSRIVFWIYQRTTERSLLRGMQADNAAVPAGATGGARPDAGSPQVELLQSIEAMADVDEKEIEATVKTAAWLKTTKDRIQRWVLLPLQVVFWLIAMAAMVPVFVLFGMSQ
ncbi:MAG: hypothetical protein JNL67_21450 [Planctomycetaceae bacterium]|nr:hypothetical protein [Planctomycetaceae bacterium]